MKRFLLRIARFFSWRGAIRGFLWIVTLLILFHVEEDWRGARVWAATKAKWEANGVSFDPNAYIPPAVPDDQNFAALPLFKLSPDPDDNTLRKPVALEAAFRNDHNHPNQIAPLSPYSMHQKDSADFGKLHRDIAALYVQVFGTPPASSDALIQFEAIYPFVEELNTAAAMRPYFRLKEDYTTQETLGRSFELLTSQIKVARILSIHALLALNQKRPDVALRDINTLAKMVMGISQEPSLLSGLVSVGICTINTEVVGYGISIHAWNDAQLADIQVMFSRFDALSNFQHVMHGECICYSLPMLEFLKEQRTWAKIFSRTPHSNASFADSDILNSIFWSNGWIDLSMSRTANDLLSAASLVNPKNHRTYVDAMQRMQNEANRLQQSWQIYTPWILLSQIAAGPIGNAQLQTSHSQTWTDEVQIACALERYRLTRGRCPDSLNALLPAYIEKLPCDPINGEPYHYRLRPDGSFLLYSVGWNQKDDGGLTCDKPATEVGDFPTKHGDWVWPTPIAPSK
jgi:hypothetical protein